ncbi:MAG: hypothetical protein LBQ90_11345, partial [Synergistaceae bacterium]|nr:hypothetical protein [Synergistaceae bacterium]
SALNFDLHHVARLQVGDGTALHRIDDGQAVDQGPLEGFFSSSLSRRTSAALLPSLSGTTPGSTRSWWDRRSRAN